MGPQIAPPQGLGSLDGAVLLAGRTGGQIVNGGDGSGDGLTLRSTSHPTKGSITLNQFYDVILTQSAKPGGVATAWTLTGGAHTSLTASTEVIDVNFNLARTVQWATGALGTQRAVVIRAPTYAFVGASTIPTAATVAITGAFATITTSYALWVQTGLSAFTEGIVVPYAVWGSTDIDGTLTLQSTTDQSFVEGGTIFIENYKKLLIDQNPHDGASLVNMYALRVTSGAHTNQTAGAAIPQIGFGFFPVQWATGAITTQQAFLIDAPTYAFVGASTITNAATVAIADAPTPGANATITNAYALWVKAGLARFDGGITVGAEPAGKASTVSYTNTVDNSANNIGVGVILFKGATGRNSSGFLKILDGTTPRFLPYFDAITG